MLRLSKKLICSFEAVVDIAYHAELGTVQSNEINRRQGIPRRYLEPVLQQLVKAQILRGIRGPKGGYQLARPAHEITLGDVARAAQDIDGALKVEHDHASELGVRVIKPIWLDMLDKWLSDLDQISVADLCHRAAVNGVRKVID